MDQFNYIKLIEFHYILEGFKSLFSFENDKSPKGVMYQTASQIYNEIFNSCVRIVVREETKNKLCKKWKDVTMERTLLDIHIFNDVHYEVNSSLDEFITKKYIEESYIAQRLQSKQRDAELAVLSSTSTSASSHVHLANGSTNMAIKNLPPPVPSSSLQSSVPASVYNGSSGLEASSSKVQFQKTAINNTIANGASCYSVAPTVKQISRYNNINKSILSLDSGFRSETSANAPFTLIEQSTISEGSSKSSSSKTQRSKSKSDKNKDKFASLPKELLEAQCSSGGDTVLSRYVDKAFPKETASSEGMGHLPNAPRSLDQHLATSILFQKLELLSEKENSQ